VYLDHVTGTHGQEVLEYLSVFPKSKAEDMVTGVGVLPVKDGKFGLIRVFRHPLARWSWEIPRGMVDRGETTGQAALRELREETGFTPRKDQLCEFGTAAPAAALIGGRVRLYFAMLNSSDSPGTVEHEIGHGEMKFFGRNEIATLIELGEIEDACTMSVLLMYAIKQGSWAEGTDFA
jgi:8-oxo-dGTP pyrophosphatase MutT (NUDIX family)